MAALTGGLAILVVVDDRKLGSAAEAAVALLFGVGALLSLPAPSNVDPGPLPRWRDWVSRHLWPFVVLLAATGTAARIAVEIVIGNHMDQVVIDAALTFAAIVAFAAMVLWYRSPR